MNVDLEYDYMLKCRALYLRSIAYTFRTYLMVDDYLLEFLDKFLDEYYIYYKDMFDLIYDFNEDNNKIENTVRDNILLNRYLKDFTNNEGAKNLYDELGIENINKISMLAYLFCEYYYFIMDKFNELEYDSNIFARIRN